MVTKTSRPNYIGWDFVPRQVQRAGSEEVIQAGDGELSILDDTRIQQLRPTRIERQLQSLRHKLTDHGTAVRAPFLPWRLLRHPQSHLPQPRRPRTGPNELVRRPELLNRVFGSH